MKNFTKTKSYIIKKSKNLNACESELKKVINSKNFDELIEVISINAEWVINNKLLKNTSSVKYFGVSIMNLLNSGNRNSGYRNSGYCNSGHRNSGYNNSGDSNSGNRNSGDSNSGNSNSGDCNSGNRNSGYFNTTSPKILIIFNKPCEFDIWEKAKKPGFIYKIYLAEWIKNPKSEITNGYLKKHSYKEAWGNAFKKATPEDIDLLKNLPNFDKKIFYEITGINIK